MTATSATSATCSSRTSTSTMRARHALGGGRGRSAGAAEPLRAAADAAPGVRPRCVGADARRDRGARAGAARADPLRSCREPGGAPGRASPAAARVDRPSRRGRERGGVRGRGPGRARRGRPAVRASDAVLAVLRRPAAVPGQTARSGVIPTELGELEALRRLIGGWNKGRVAEVGGALCTAVPAAPGSALLNRVVGLGVAEPASEDALDEIDAFFGDNGVSYGITVTPDVVPSELTAWLAGRGFNRGYAWAKFRRGIEPAAALETDLTIERIRADRGDVFAEVFQRAYGTPELLRPRLEQ